MTTVMLGGKGITLDPTSAIGKGGEADVYRLDASTALKVFKTPDHPDLVGEPALQKLARERLATHQKKLREFPIKGLPSGVVQPIDLALRPTVSHAKANPPPTIVGYSMRLVAPAERLLRYGEADFRLNGSGISSRKVTDIFLNLHGLVEATHAARVVIGDFNNLNVLVQNTTPYLIDIDSAQFGQFPCVQYTMRYLDPLLAKIGHDGKAVLGHPHNENSDWYAFEAMLLETLLLVHPYHGVYRPKGGAVVGLDQRPLHRISIFDPNVRYPKIALPIESLSDDLLSHFQQVFSSKDWRGVFPRKLLEDLRWTRCPSCGLEHSRSKCPVCATAVPTLAPQVQIVHGTVTAKRVFSTTGTIITATVEDGHLLYLFTDGNTLYREGGTSIGSGGYDPEMRVRLSRHATLIGKGDRFFTISLGSQSPPEMQAADGLLGGTGRLAAPVFDVNARHRYWSADGHLWRDGEYGPEIIGNVLRNQTLFWVGPSFGFGFYRAGPIAQAFVFGADDRVINDNVDLAAGTGELLDATALFAGHRCWLLTATQEGESIVHRCTVIHESGRVEGTAEAVHGDGSWLGTLRSACAVGSMLLVATDEGIVRVEVSNGRPEQTRAFPDTEPFVKAGSMLLPASSGIYVIDRKEIRLLTIS